tara:strand:- start:8429 stop:12292 length:3864 start_codon:yes stop_codon:yes gene_type:complete
MTMLPTKYEYLAGQARRRLPVCNVSQIVLSENSYEKVRKEEGTEYIKQDRLRRIPARSGDFVSQQKDLQIDLSVVLYIDKIMMERFLFHKSPEHLKIRVLQCSAENIYDAISNDPSPFLAPGNPLPDTITQYVEFKEYKLSDIIPNSINTFSGQSMFGASKANTSQAIGQVMKNYKKCTLSDGSELYQVPVSFRFNIDHEFGGSNVEHLSYFITSCYDGEEIFSERNINAAYLEKDNIRKSTTGFVTSELVISNSQTVKDTYAYHDSRGNYWLGPVHYHGSRTKTKRGYTGYMAGTNNHMRSGLQSPKLSQKTYKNCKIIDHRIMSNFKDKISLMDFSDRTDRIIPGGVLIFQPVHDKRSSEFRKSKNVFSDLYHTIDKNKNIRFIFHADMHQALKNIMKYPGLLDNIKMRDPDAYETLVGTDRVLQVRLFRKQLKNFSRMGNESRQALIENDITAQEQLIYESDGQGIYDSKAFTRQKETLKNENSNISYFVESPITVASGVGIKTFTGTDLEVGSLNHGKYEYRIEMNLFDPTISILADAQKKIENILNGKNYGAGSEYHPGLDSYLEESMSKRSYLDANLNRFTYEFYEHYKKNYSYQARQPTSDFIFSKIKNFVEVVATLNGNMSRQELTELCDYMVNICSPVTGTPQGIDTVVGIISQYLEKISHLISSIRKIKRRPSDQKERDSTPNIVGSGGDRTETISHVFDSKVDMQKIRAEKYYDFLNINKSDIERNPDGLYIVGAGSYIERTRLESQKYFTDINNNINITTGQGKNITSGDTVNRTRFTFLSPSRVFLDDFGERSLEILNGGQLNQDRKRQNSALTELISHNLNKINQLMSTPRESQESLLQFLGTSGVSVRDDHNYVSKRAETLETMENLDVLGDTNASYRNVFKDDDSSFRQYEDTNLREDESYRDTAEKMSQIFNFDIFSTYNDDKFYNLSEDCEVEPENNIRKVLTKNGDRDNISSVITKFPNQLKALILAGSNPLKLNSNSAIRQDEENCQDEIPKNSMRDINNQGYVYFNYKIIQRVQVLRSFETDGMGGSVSSPIWTDLEEVDLNKSRGSLLFCRMVSYNKPEYGYERQSMLSLPTLNDIFFIDVSQTSYSANANNRITVSGNKYRNRQTKSNNNSFSKIFQASLENIAKSRAAYLESRNYSSAGTEFTQSNNKIKLQQKIDIFGINTSAVREKTQSLFGNLTNSEIVDKLVSMGYGDAVVSAANANQGQTKSSYIQTYSYDQGSRVPFSSGGQQRLSPSRAAGRGSSGGGGRSSGGGGRSSGGGGSTY